MKKSFKKVGIAISLMLATTACGKADPTGTAHILGADSGVHDSGTMDAATTYDAGVVADAGGGDAQVAVDSGSCTPSRLLIATSDFSTGAGFGTLDLATKTPHIFTTTTADTDTVPFYDGCNAFLLEQQRGNVKVQSPDDLFTSSLTVSVDATGTDGGVVGTDPQAIAEASGTKYYVTRLLSNSIAIVDISKPANMALTGTIDLSSLLDSTDTDGFVDMSGIIVVDGYAYVGLGSYYYDTSFAQQWAGMSKVAVIDVSTNALVTSIALPHHNPTSFAVSGTDLYVVAGGAYSVADGAIDIIDLTNNTVKSTPLITEDSVSLTQFSGLIPISSTSAYLLTTGLTSADETISQISLSTGAIGNTLVENDVLTAVATGGTLYVAIRPVTGSGVGGILLFNASTGDAITPTTPITFGAYPIEGISLAP